MSDSKSGAAIHAGWCLHGHGHGHGHGHVTGEQVKSWRAGRQASAQADT